MTGKVAQEHPEEAAKFTRAVLKSAQWVNTHKDEAAQIQIAKDWTAGDAEANAEVLKTYSYKPDINGGIEALKTTVPDLQTLGIISSDKSVDEIIKEITYTPEGVSNADFENVTDAPKSVEEALK